MARVYILIEDDSETRVSVDIDGHYPADSVQDKEMHNALEEAYARIKKLMM